MALDLQALIGEVAKRHNVRLGADDPVLITVTLNEVILAQHLEQVRAVVEEAQNQTAAATAQQVAAIKGMGERLVTNAGGYVGERVTEAGVVLKADLVAAIRAETARAQAAAVAARRAETVAIWSIGAAVLLCAGFMVFSRWGFGLW